MRKIAQYKIFIYQVSCSTFSLSTAAFPFDNMQIRCLIIILRFFFNTYCLMHILLFRDYYDYTNLMSAQCSHSCPVSSQSQRKPNKVWLLMCFGIKIWSRKILPEPPCVVHLPTDIAAQRPPSLGPQLNQVSAIFWESQPQPVPLSFIMK